MSRPLKPLPPRDPKKTLLVDSLNLAFRWKHTGNDFDMPTDFISTVKSLANSYDCGQIVILADGGSSWRRSLHPGYKMSRRKRHENATEEEKRDSERFFEYYQQTLDNCEFPILRYQGVEADDIAAHLVKHKNKYDLEYIWLISSDRDWDLLIQENVGRFSYVTRKEVRLDNWKEHYDIDPEEYISLKCLTGDKGDNVPGIPGIGPKRAVQLIEQYGTAFDIYNVCPIESRYKYIQSLNENAEQLLVNYELMDLMTYCDDAIGADNISDIQGRMTSVV